MGSAKSPLGSFLAPTNGPDPKAMPRRSTDSGILSPNLSLNSVLLISSSLRDIYRSTLEPENPLIIMLFEGFIIDI